ncbi:MAG: hypothetical protein WDO68_12835 [Gammaproteobacteria bacterium]
MWKALRICVLLLVLAGVVAAAWLDRVNTTSWDKTLWVGIFPLNGDGSAAAARYINALTVEDFASIETFFAQQASRYGVKIDRPVRVDLYPSPRELPPHLESRANRLQVIWWSLKTRLYARRAADVPGRPHSHIRVFVLYHDPKISEVVPHSLGMQRGLIGVVHAFADKNMTGSNSIVIAHETMHTVGATDKYDLETGAPSYPSGYGEPALSPRFPQRYAELMAGQRALSDHAQEMPETLRDVVVGSQTAEEIGWARH